MPLLSPSSEGGLQEVMLDDVAAAILEEIGRSRGIRFGPARRTTMGESASTFVVRAGDEAFILKLEPAGRAKAHRQAARATQHLAGLGYPTPLTLATGVAWDHAYTLRTRLPGEPMAPADAGPIAQLIDLVELQAGAAWASDLPADLWPGSVVDPVLLGGDGFCVLQTMRDHSPETRALLERLQELVTTSAAVLPRADDIVHYDFNPANILVEAGQVSGVIDWEGARAGDRAFDLATLLFYAYESDASRRVLWARLQEMQPLPVIAVYLAHAMLRQVEWSLRLHAPAVGRRYLDRAHRVLADIASRDGGGAG